MTEWIGTLQNLAAENESAVLVTVGRVRGSAPRETGARMIVTKSHTSGSIGGGRLEYDCTELACQMLKSGDQESSVAKRTFPLGPDLGQCCGGVVDIVFELLPISKAGWFDQAVQCYETRVPAVVVTMTGTDPRSVIVMSNSGRTGVAADVLDVVDEILGGRSGAAVVGDALLVPLAQGIIEVAVFGAGHVGAAVVELLSKLDCSVRWIDSRRRIFPESLPTNVTALESNDPAREIAALPAGAYCLVMTHSHPLDLDICYQALTRDDLAYRGLIGSLSKRRRFGKRLVSMGLSVKQLEDLVCPIGVDGITGKKPAEIAVSVVAQVLQIRDRRQGVVPRPQSLEALG